MTMIHHLPADPTVVGRFAARRAELFAELSGRAAGGHDADHVHSDPRPAQVARGRIGQGELSPREMIPDTTLRRLARGEPEAQRGEMTEALQIELTMILPDLCAELLAWRALADAEGRG